MRNSVFKKMFIVIIILVMTSNFIMPNYVYAESIQNKIVSGVFYLVAFIGDTFISIMQKIMVGTGELQEFGEYKIKYSPGIIFSNVVPALDVNFITATEADNESVSRYTKNITTKNEMIQVAKKLSSSDFTEVYSLEASSSITNPTDWATVNEDIREYGLRVSNTYDAGMNYVNGYIITAISNNQYVLKVTNYGNWGAMKDIEGVIEGGYSGNLTSVMLYIFAESASADAELYKVETRGNKSTIYKGENALDKAITALQSGDDSQITLKSTAFALKDNIARWYIALRTFALVGLLSVLLYLGIRIILSSASAQNKAKYKNMLMDWLVAICILFVLHYFMAFMLTFVGRINSMLAGNVTTDSVTGLQADGIMSNVRTMVGESLENSKPGLDIAGYTVMYFVLVILTISFTFQYLKRVIYMAFLTMIAPLIALTYPLDKVKDGKAQAFSFWIKEYIVNCLIQPVHLLLYTLLVTNAMEFATENVLYSIVAITFLMPAEKIIKQMFGLNSQQSGFNTLGAAAGGAMVMNMLNKAKGLGPKGNSGKDGGAGSGDSEGNNNVRTATRNPGDPTASAGGTAGPAGATGGAGSPGGGGSAGGSGGGTGSSGGTGGSGGGTGGSPGGGSRPGIAKTGANLAKAIAGPDRLKSAGRWVAKGMGAGAGALIGLSTAVADGNFDDVFTKTAMGASAGAAIGNNLVDTPGAIAGGIGNAVGGIKDDFLRTQMGEEAFQNAQFDKQFYNSSGYKKIASSGTLKSMYSTDQIKAQTQMFLDNGITDAGKIQEALESGVNGDEYRLMSDIGVTDVKKYSKIKRSKSGLNASEIASRMAIAKNMPTELYGDETAFVRYAKRYGIQERDAKTLFRDIDDFA